MGCVVAIVVSVVIFPVSGVATATAGCVEALAEAEAAAGCLARCLQRSYAVEPAGGREGSGGAAGKAAGEGDKGAVLEKPAGSESEALLWDDVRGHMERAEVSCKHVTLQLASIRAYPISKALAQETEGAKLLDLLYAKASSVDMTMKVCVWGEGGEGGGVQS